MQSWAEGPLRGIIRGRSPLIKLKTARSAVAQLVEHINHDSCGYVLIQMKDIVLLLCDIILIYWLVFFHKLSINLCICWDIGIENIFVLTGKDHDKTVFCILLGSLETIGMFVIEYYWLWHRIVPSGPGFSTWTVISCHCICQVRTLHWVWQSNWWRAMKHLYRNFYVTLDVTFKSFVVS